jgi:UDP-N-acetylglucosamine acyltransferase
MTKIHSAAVVDDSVELGEGVSIGPFCVLTGQVEIGDGVEVISNTVITGNTTIGKNTQIFPFSSIGHQPQDLKYKGELSRLEIGANNTIREHVTINPGTEGGGMVTKIGNNCLFMVGSHVAHDCRIEDHVILVNNATLAGHVEIGEWAIVGGLSAVHQFVRIGKHAMVGGMTGVESDIIPYGTVVGNRARLQGLNIVGLRRRNFSRKIVHDIRKAYRLIFAEEGTMSERIEDVAQDFAENEAVMEIVDFIGKDSSRSICQPHMDDAA